MNIVMLVSWRKNSSDVIFMLIFAHIVSLQSIVTIQYNYTTSKGLYSKCSGLCTIFSNHYAYTVGKLVVATVWVKLNAEKGEKHSRLLIL